MPTLARPLVTSKPKAKRGRLLVSVVVISGPILGQQVLVSIAGREFVSIAGFHGGCDIMRSEDPGSNGCVYSPGRVPEALTWVLEYFDIGG